jgi:mediator of RNA polymerase II transcription subunit 25
LAAALEVFDELEKDERMKGMISVTRHCLLVACNPPYQSVASQNDSFSGHTAIQLARMLGERNINLSVISAWKHPDLQNLHTEACVADVQLQPDQDVAVIPSDLVLLQGFRLPDPKESQTAKMSGEKTPTPASDIKQKVSEPDETPASVSERVPNQSTLNPGIQSQPVVPPKTTVTTTAPIKPEIIGSLDMISQGPPPNQVAPFSASFPGHSSMQQISKPSIGPIPSATVSPAVSMPSVTPKVSVPVQPSLSQQMTQNLSFPGPRVSTPATNPVHPSMEVSAAVPQMPVQQTPFPHITVQAVQRHCLWTGMLEWQELNRQFNTRTPRSMMTSIFAAATDNLQASAWPSRLVMSLMSSKLLQTILPLLKANKRVYFKAQADSAAYPALHESLTHEMIGWISIPAPSDIRCIVMVWNSQKRVFMGIIPNDQVSVMRTIKVSC